MTDDHPIDRWLTVSRRRFLAGATALGATVVLVTDAGGVQQALSLGRRTLTRTVRRRNDQLSLKFDFYNLVRDTRAGQPSQLIRKFPGLGTFVVVTFPPQSVAEQAFTYEDTNAQGPAGALVSGPTRLVFAVPESITKVPFTMTGLLDWFPWALNLTPSAAGVAGLAPHAPTPSETSIELPWRLILSPVAEPARAGTTAPEPTWAHASKPVTHGGRTELWHTRLASAHRPGPRDPRPRSFVSEVDPGPVRAIWAVDSSPVGDLDPFGIVGSPMLASQRKQIVANMPTSTIDVRRLMLSPLGGFFEGGGSWPEGQVIEWRHRSSLGRDHYVKVVEAGYLYPLGHPAAMITVTERQFTTAQGHTTAFLRKRQFIVLRRQTKEYTESTGATNARRFPFGSVMIQVHTTPDIPIADPELAALVVVNAPTGGPVTYEFPCIGIDRDGRSVQFSTPLVWVPKIRAFAAPGNPTQVTDAVGPLFRNELRSRPLGGQRISIVPSRAAAAGADSGDGRDTSLIADAFVLDGLFADGNTITGQPSFAPVMQSASVHVPALIAATGSDTAVTIRWANTYLVDGLPDTAASQRAGLAAVQIPNAAEVYASIVPATPDGTGLPVQLPPGRAGGVAAPSFAAEGLSRAKGAVADLEGLAAQKFDPAQYFKAVDGIEAKILGTLPLADILATVEAVDGAIDRLPNLHTTLVYPDNDHHRTPIASLTIVDFEPKAKPDPLNIFQPSDLGVDGRPGTRVKLHVEIRTDFVDPAKSTYKIHGLLSDFTLQLIGNALPAIDIPVYRMEFTSATGAKDDLSLDIGKVTFKGVMSFVDDFSRYMSFGGKSGPYVDVTPTGIKAGMHLMLPSIGAGLFQIANVAFSAAINLPFDGRMRLDMSFSSRKDPFLVTVFGIGGGGWVTLGMGIDGFESFEIGLEFGASVALDLGVASGEVHVFIGIYFKLSPVDVPNEDHPEQTDNVMQAAIEAYLRIGGSVEVLGLVTLSIELYIGFTYVLPNGHDSGNTLIGRATLVMEVSVLMFSESVSVEVERKIKGPKLLGDLAGLRAGAVATDPDRTFGQQVSSADWTDYCAAFATGA